MNKDVNITCFSVIACAWFVSSCPSPTLETKNADVSSLQEVLDQDSVELLILNPQDSAIAQVALKAEFCGTLDEQFAFIGEVSLLSSREGILYVIEHGTRELWGIDWKNRNANKIATLDHSAESMYDMSVSQNQDIVITTPRRIYVYGHQETSFVNLHGITNILADRDCLLSISPPLKEVNLESDRGWTLTRYRYDGTELSRYSLPIEKARVNESWEDIFVTSLNNEYAILLQNSGDYILCDKIGASIELRTLPHKTLSLMSAINRKMIRAGERYQVLMIIASAYGDSLVYVYVGDHISDYLLVVDQANVLRGIVDLGKVGLRLQLPKIAVVHNGNESYCFVTIRKENRDLAAIYRFSNLN